MFFYFECPNLGLFSIGGPGAAVIVCQTRTSVHPEASGSISSYLKRRNTKFYFLALSPFERWRSIWGKSYPVSILSIILMHISLIFSETLSSHGSYQH